jgi:hypothetical protein
MATIWERRELPILKVIADFDSSGLRPDHHAIYDGLEDEDHTLVLEEIMAGLVALAEAAEPPFIKVKFVGVDQEDLPVRALDIRPTERGYRAVGAWPSADPYEQLMKLLAERIDAEEQPEIKGKLEQFRESVQGIGREVVVGVLTSLAKQSAGLPP